MFENLTMFYKINFEARFWELNLKAEKSYVFYAVLKLLCLPKAL